MDPLDDVDGGGISIEPDPVGAAIQVAGAFARAAVGRRDAVLEALAVVSEDTLPEEQVTAEASLAVVALYLSLAAVKRYGALTGAAAPIMESVLDPLLEDLDHMRDTVMHWEGKAERSPGSALVVDTNGIFIVAGHKRKGPQRLAAIRWKEFEDSASRVQRWARFMLEHPEEWAAEATP